jgi:multidrug efflux system outer membrane protein
MRVLPAALLATAVFVTSCALGPNYRRPEIAVPEEHRGQVGPVEAESLADLPWWEVFQDGALQALIGEALRDNYDLRIAASRVEQAREFVGVVRSDVFPQVGYQAAAGRQRSPAPGLSNNPTFNSFLGAFNLSWEIDLWGRIRRATEAAFAQYLAAEEFRRGILLSLTSDVAQAYFELRELDLELEIARRTTGAFQRTLDLFSQRYAAGVGSQLEVTRAEAALADTAAAIPELERQIVIKENQLSILLGRNPGPIDRGLQLEAQPLPPTVPAGLPSSLLERRPDLRQAEDGVIAANALVGVAVADFFPRVSLTGLYGGQSTEIENIVKGAGNVWAIAGSLAGPIFQGGRLVSSYRQTVAAWEEAKEQYERAALSAFQEVSNTLVTQQKLSAIREQRERSVRALRESVRLSLVRYNSGLATYFEVLEAQQQLFPAENFLAQTQRDQLIAVVVLYRALGGGWQLDDAAWTGPHS